MEEHFQVRPNLLQMFLSCQFHHSNQHRQHPRRHSRNVGNVLRERFAGDTVALYLEVAQQCHLFRRHTHKVCQRIDVLYENGTQISNERIGQVIVWRMASAEYKTLTAEKPAVRIVAQVVSHNVLATLIMQGLQALVRNWNELTLIVCRARRLCIPFHLSRPQYVFLAVSHTVDVVFQFFVGVYRYVLRKVFVRLDSRKQMVSSIFRIFSALYQVL